MPFSHEKINVKSYDLLQKNERKMLQNLFETKGYTQCMILQSRKRKQHFEPIILRFDV